MKPAIILSNLIAKSWSHGRRVVPAIIVAYLGLAAGSIQAQDPSTLPYRNPRFSAEQRAADLVGRMSLEEKASQLVNQSRPIPRLGVPAYDWWSEALHGVAVRGATQFPEPIGLAATFDVPGIHDMAASTSIEARVVHAKAVHLGDSAIFHGLDVWAPNINIFRDPRWGRGQETYGEDPFLSARLGVAYVTGMQGDDPHYYRVISTPKHFSVHSGPEPTRHFADVDVSKHDEEDTYFPAFRAAVVEGHAGSVMCAYNSIHGEPACANDFLLQHTLRGAWRFEGYVVSDCRAIRDIFNGHRYRPTQAQASAIALERGMDNECIDYTSKVNDNQDYKPYIDAVQQGYLAEDAINTALIRLFTARIRLGLFDPPSMVPYNDIASSELDSAAHRALARRLADESMVLLKNDGVLPLKSPNRIAIVGPLAGQTRVLLGNYSGIPSHAVSMLEGMRAEFPQARITYVPGTQFLRNDVGTPLPNNLLTNSDGKPGLRAEYVEELAVGMLQRPRANPILVRTEPNVDLEESNLPLEMRNRMSFGAEWTGFLTVPESGDYLIGLNANGFTELRIEGAAVAREYDSGEPQIKLARVHLEKGHKSAIDITYTVMNGSKPHIQLLWAKYDPAPSPEAEEAARNADVVIAVVGLTSQLEGEESPIDVPGFLGGDRTNLELPEPEEELIRRVAAIGKPLVVTLMNGSALGVNWEKAHANAILEARYPGEEGGAAIADTLSGKNNPSGRLPVTFYKDVHQLPDFEDYSMEGRTYRYFKGEPLWPFGYGLSYTRFSYSNLTLSGAQISASDPLNVSVEVTNAGKVAGDEVAQLYLKFPDLAGAPIRALRGFQRVHLQPGERQKLEFHLDSRDLSMVTEAGDIIVAPGKYGISVGGGQPGTEAPSVSDIFEVNGRIMLPE